MPTRSATGTWKRCGRDACPFPGSAATGRLPFESIGVCGWYAVSRRGQSAPPGVVPRQFASHRVAFSHIPFSLAPRHSLRVPPPLAVAGSAIPSLIDAWHKNPAIFARCAIVSSDALSVRLLIAGGNGGASNLGVAKSPKLLRVVSLGTEVAYRWVGTRSFSLHSPHRAQSR